MKLNNLFRKRYRVVRDNYLGYEVQVKVLGLFWMQHSVNTHSTLEDAIRYLDAVSNKVVYQR